MIYFIGLRTLLLPKCPLKPLKSLAEFNSRVCMSVCVTLCVCVCVRVTVVRVCVCVCEWRGEFNRVVLVVQLGLIVYFLITFYLCKIFFFYNAIHNHSNYFTLSSIPSNAGYFS
jgi:hypothetical protein